MKGTKAEMMKYKHSAKRLIARWITEYPIENAEIQRQIDGNIQKFNDLAEQMNMRLNKRELRLIYQQLVNTTRTIKYILEEQEKLIKAFNFDSPGVKK